MALIYVRSTTGSDANGGTSWADAKATLAGAAAIDAAGDTVCVSQAHAESTAAGITHNWAGTLAAPTRIVCGNDGAEPPTALATTATVTTTAGGAITMDGAVYCYGITFASNGNLVIHTTSSLRSVFEHCVFKLTAGGQTFLRVGNSSGVINNRIDWINCDYKPSFVSDVICHQNGLAEFRWNGGSIQAGSASPNTNLFGISGGSPTGRYVNFNIQNVDFSNFGSSFLFTNGASFEAPMRLRVRSCALPSNWAGSLGAGSPGRLTMQNCASGTQNYKTFIEDYGGTIKDETIIVRTGGASDGLTTLSWKMSTNANNVYPSMFLESDEIVRRFPGTDAEISAWVPGTSKTITVELIHDSATPLTDADVWLDVSYLDISGSPQEIRGHLVRSKAADILATPVNHTTSAAVWGDQSPSMANPNAQKMSVTIAPQLKGYLHARVCLALASKTIYVDPKLTVS